MSDPEPPDVRERLIVAATELMGERPASSVTVREIAEHAGLHHSLIHRHFGGKDALLREVLARLASRYCEAVGDAVPGESPAAGFMRAFAYLVDDPAAGASAFANTRLIGGGPTGQTSFPGVERHLDQLGMLLDGAATAADPRVVTVAAIAFMGGWSMLEDWAMVAADLEDLGIDEVRRQVAGMLQQLLEAQLAAPSPGAPS